MRTTFDFLVAVCDPDPGWIKNQINCRRKVGLVGKDSQLLLDTIQNPSKKTQTMNIWLAVVDETQFNAKSEPILQLAWPDRVSNFKFIEDDLWTWAWYKSSVLPNLKIWLYQYNGDGSLYRNSLQRGIVHSIKDTDNALTTTEGAGSSATTFYVSLNIESLIPQKATEPLLSSHLPPGCLTLQCYTTVTKSIRLPIQL